MEKKHLVSLVTISLILICNQGLTQPNINQNYILTNIVKQSGVTTEPMVNNLTISTQGKMQTISYIDGLGRSLQNIMTQGSPAQKDIVTGTEYDQYGREITKYLPYSDNSGLNGSYRSGWKTSQASFYNGQLTNVDVDVAPYATSVLEPSPIGRTFAQGAPGTAWQPNPSNAYDASTHSVKVQYLLNNSLDSVRIFNMDSAGTYSSPGFFSAMQLSSKVTTDEQGQVVKEFSDKTGHTVCKRVMMPTDSIQTYYIYDNLDMLRAVIQPEGVVALKVNNWVYPSNFAKNWMFLYRYDVRGRMVMKKIPGADSVVMMYDQWDRLVLSQDGNLRAGHNFLFTKYDQLNRPVMTGQITDTRALSAVQTDVANATGRFETVSTSATEGYTMNSTFPSSSSYTLTVYTITHYDDYANLPSWKSNYAFVNEYSVATQNNNLQGQVVATQTRVLGTSNYMRTVSYYDDKYRVIQVSADNAAGGVDRITKILSFDGKVTNDYHNHTSRFYTTPLLVQQIYTYDHVDRLLNVTHQIASQEIVTISQNAYNEVGQLLNKKIHQSASHPAYLQKLDYYYNIRGWLKNINKPTPATAGYEESDLFNEELHYNTFSLLYGVAQYNGNISEALWKSGYDEYQRGYYYFYDAANRITNGAYAFKTSSWQYTKKYDENQIVYDHNGNLTNLSRYHGDFAGINSLFYGNYAGNQVGYVTDRLNNTSPVGFHNRGNVSGYDYHYDANGNTTDDYNKNITLIQYNFLNLSTSVNIPGTGNIAYTYDAAGNKLQKTMTDSTVSPRKITNYYYAGDFVYRNDTLEFISFPEGRLRPSRIDTTQAISIANLKYTYDYFMKDHLGSVRAVLTTEQETDQYAATMEAAASSKENQLFSNISSTVVTKPGGFDTDTTNAQVSQLHGNINVSPNKRVGPSIVLKVMAGDTVSISSYAWYTGATQAPATGVPAIINDLLPLLTNGVVGDGGTHGGSISSTNINTWMNTALTTFLTNTYQPYDNTRPKAFLNWVIVDEEFKAVTSTNHLGSVQIPLISGATQKQLLVGPTNMVVRRNGYLYVYVSNESNQYVDFDNLVIQHRRGPLLEQKDYYPFGLEIPGLSTQAFKPSGYDQNRYKYNGKEYDTAFALDKYDYGARMYDPQIGRWGVNDRLADKYMSTSPYTYVLNRPIIAIDPDGKRVYFVGGAGNDQDGWDYIQRWSNAFKASGINDFVRVNASKGKPADIEFTAAYRNSGFEQKYVDFDPASSAGTFEKTPDSKAVDNSTINKTVDYYKQQLKDNPLKEGDQFNLAGYSYGSVLQAQAALKLANGGQVIDNLVLIGSPIPDKSDLMKQLKSNKNIKNVIRYDIKGDLLSNPQDVYDFIKGGLDALSDDAHHFDAARPGKQADELIKLITEWAKKNGVKN